MRISGCFSGLLVGIDRRILIKCSRDKYDYTKRGVTLVNHTKCGNILYGRGGFDFTNSVNNNYMENIMNMPIETELSDQDIVNLFMGLVRLVKRQQEQRIAQLVAQLDEVITKVSGK